MPDDYKDIITFEIGKVNYLYIADGHHRAASAFRAKQEMQKKNTSHTGEEEYNFFMAVLFPAEQLKILSYNRVVFDLKHKDENSFFENVKKYFTIDDTASPNPPSKETICMYINKNGIC